MNDRQIDRWLGASSSLPIAALLFMACTGVVSTSDDESNGAVSGETGGSHAVVHPGGGVGGTSGETTTTTGGTGGSGGGLVWRDRRF